MKLLFYQPNKALLNFRIILQDTFTYEEEFKIRSSEVAPDGKAKLQSICDLLQETAGNHALNLNFDISQLKEKNLTWVLHRLHVVMDQYPKWRDRITVKTWPSSGDTLRAYRDFVILNNGGNEIGRGLSYWLMIDTTSRRPVRMPEEVLEMAPADTDHVLDVKSDRIMVEGSVAESKEFRVRRSDLDVNRHVNNVKYIEWALEALPDNHGVTEIDIEFRAECTLGESVNSEYIIPHGKDADMNFHQITKSSDRKVATVALTR